MRQSKPKTPAITIIVPVYNAGQFLAQCISSVIRQTHTPFELLLVNDGSIDDSLEIMRQFEREDTRIRVIDQRNSGVSAARNAGLETAKGEYIMFIDADDYLMTTDALEKLFAANTQSCDVVMYEIFYEGKKARHPSKSKIYSSKNEMDSFLFSMIKSERLNSPCNKLYRKTIIDRYTIRFDPHIKMGEDLLFNIEYFKRCQVVRYLNEQLYFYRMSNNSSATSAYGPNRYNDLMTVNDALRNWLATRSSVALVQVSHYIRLKNIISSLRSLNHPHASLTLAQKLQRAERYKTENLRIIVKQCGLMMYIISQIYSVASVAFIRQLVKVLSR